jgi:hypothetical protein
LGAKVSSWLDNLLKKSAQGTIPIIQNVSAKIIYKAISLYYGID